MKRTEPTRAVQYFSDEYLEYCKQLTPTQILQFIAQFQRLHWSRHRQAERLELEQHEEGTESESSN